MQPEKEDINVLTEVICERFTKEDIEEIMKYLIQEAKKGENIKCQKK